MVANIWAHTDTENNDSEEDDNNDDNSDELYKEWSDIPSRCLQFLYQHNNINNSFLYTVNVALHALLFTIKMIYWCYFMLIKSRLKMK